MKMHKFLNNFLLTLETQNLRNTETVNTIYDSIQRIIWNHTYRETSITYTKYTSLIKNGKVNYDNAWEKL